MTSGTEPWDPTLLAILAGWTAIVLVYYAGTRGIFVWTRRFKGRWERRALISLSLALLYAPSLVVVGGSHGGAVIPGPAWMAAVAHIHEGWWKPFWIWGVGPIAATWAALYALASRRRPS